MMFRIVFWDVLHGSTSQKTILNELIFSFHLLEITYRTATQQMLSTTFMKPRIRPSCITKFYYQSVYCCLIQLFLLVHALLNASEIAGNDFNAH
jgi:hypothetical protein